MTRSTTPGFRLVASAISDSTARVWDVELEQYQAVIQDHPDNRLQMSIFYSLVVKMDQFLRGRWLMKISIECASTGAS